MNTDRHPERGQVSAEYVGMLVFVVGVVVLILAAGPEIGGALKSAMCRAFDVGCSGGGIAGGPSPTTPGGSPLTSGGGSGLGGTLFASTAEPVPDVPGSTAPSDPAADAEEARREGAALADRFREYDGTNPEVLDEVIDELAAHKDDPNFTSAFYGRLGPRAQFEIPRILNLNPDHVAAAENLRLFSEALGTAAGASDPAPGFEEFMDSFLRPPGEGNWPLAWERAALLRYADNLDQAWLAEVAKVNGLVPTLADPDMDRRYAIAANPSLGLPQDGLALWLDVLGNNPGAAREALSTATASGDDPSDRWANLSDNIGLFQDMTAAIGTGDEISEALGNALAAGSGVHDEQMGDHSADASRFAYEVMTTVPDHEVGWPLKQSLAEVAGSYAHEVAFGSHPAQGQSSMPGTVGDSGVAGLDPSFSLSFEDTYAFMRTFANDDTMTAPFNTAMGTLHEDLLDAGADQDRAEGDANLDNLRRVTEQLGFVAGVQHQSQLAVRGDMDDADQRVATLMGDILTFGIGKIPSPQGIARKVAWEAFQYGANKLIGEATEISPTRVELLENREVQATLAGPRNTADRMIRAGIEFPVPPPASIVDSSGALLPFGDLVREPDRLVTFNGWLVDNGLGGTDNNAPGQQAFSIAGSGDGMADAAQDRAGELEDE